MACAGAITYGTEISNGTETAPHAIAALYVGANRGKKLIQIT